MEKNIIDRLNQLNQQFYQQVAVDFDETRSHEWVGWQKLLDVPKIKQATEKKEKLFVLDLGCGNGRFAKFLLGQNLKLRYLGIDSSQKLLNLGLQQDVFRQHSEDLRLEEFDLVQNLLEAGENSRGMDFGEFDLAVAFGFLHHLPSLALRKKFMANLARQINKNGLVVVTAWRFDRDEKLMSRKRDFREIDITTGEIEANDFLLDWQRGATSYRYCHLILPVEMEQLIQGSGLKVVQTYSSDGKSGDLNDYYLCKLENRSTLSL